MKISARGQVTIPKHHRRRFGLKPSTQVEFVAEKGQLVLKKADPRKRKVWEKYYGVLGLKNTRTDDLMKELRDR